jgi:hypothetical protein
MKWNERMREPGVAARPQKGGTASNTLEEIRARDRDDNRVIIFMFHGQERYTLLILSARTSSGISYEGRVLSKPPMRCNR